MGKTDDEIFQINIWEDGEWDRLDNDDILPVNDKFGDYIEITQKFIDDKTTKKMFDGKYSKIFYLLTERENENGELEYQLTLFTKEDFEERDIIISMLLRLDRFRDFDIDAILNTMKKYLGDDFKQEHQEMWHILESDIQVE